MIKKQKTKRNARKHQKIKKQLTHVEKSIATSLNKPSKIRHTQEIKKKHRHNLKKIMKKKVKSNT